MADKYFGKSIGKLGYGNMRLPKVDGNIDFATIDKMIDKFMMSGFSYFDTAYVYESSEEVLNKSLVSRYPRDSFQITTKLAMMVANDAQDMQKQIDTSLARLGVDFVDIYLLHGLKTDFIKAADKFGAWDFMRNLKEKGIVKHIGFSFHGTPEELDELLHKHPYVEIVQLQLNYLDWDSSDVQARRLYEIARSHGTPISVMEPNKGGWLAGETSEAGKLLKSANPNVSAASWAFRYLLELEGIATILTGMGTLEELEDNINTFTNFKPLSADERKLIDKAIEIINATPSIPCTSCNYCIPHCPEKIAIPAYLRIYSNYLIYKNLDTLKHIDFMLGSQGGQAKQCISCGKCEKVCPQNLGIADVMAKAAELIAG
ncbi:MAG: aldo/keto reductase [Oscillospiraceae bacterium]|nr:aldo/keto reductase [Oscillospiraceae bacterium]